MARAIHVQHDPPDCAVGVSQELTQAFDVVERFFFLQLSVNEILDFRDMFINSLFPAFLLEKRDMFINSLFPAALLDFKDMFMSSLAPKVLFVLADFTDPMGSLRPDIVLMVTSSLIILGFAGSWNGIPNETSSGCAPE